MIRTAFLRVVDAPDKAKALLFAMANEPQRSRVDIDPTVFGEIPGSPFAYGLSAAVRDKFRSLEPFETKGRLAKVGMNSSNDFRFVRLWFEPPCDKPSKAWAPYAKGGGRSEFYADLNCVVNWRDSGRELKAYAETTSGTTHWSRRLSGYNLYFRPGITWPLRTSRFSPRPMPAQSIFSVRGYSAFTPPGELTFTLGLLASSAVDALFKVCLGRANHPEFVTGVLKRLPWPSLELGDQQALARFAQHGWRLQRSLDTANEISHAYVRPALLEVEGESFAERGMAWAERVVAVQSELEDVQLEIDELGFALYGISEDDRRAIVEGFGIGAGVDEGDSGSGDDLDDDGGEVVELDPIGLAGGLVSWAVGVAVGRFDLRLATGERSLPEESDPFDPLPVCSPGMLTDADGLPAVTCPYQYGVETSPVLVNDPGHRLDITLRVRSVFDAVFGERADHWWRDVGAALDAKRGEVGGWLGRGFFDHHLKTYSKSGRKAPILWPIGTRSGSYVIWLYAHRVSADSLFQALNDMVVPKLEAEERELSRLRQDAEAGPTASQRKTIDSLERLVGELREFREELEAVAPLWAPDLNDGVVIVLAPMWRLFAHHRVWSNELKRHWTRLANGDYDWTHLAMALWPDRVVPKCAEERSLAIAHGLEDVFWVQDPDNEDKWLARQIPPMPIDQIIAQRHNPAAAAALLRADR